jgi:hypothetical protein
VVGEKFVVVRSRRGNDLLFDQLVKEVDEGVLVILGAYIRVRNDRHIVGVVSVGNGARHASPVAPFLEIEVSIIFERLGRRDCASLK